MTCKLSSIVNPACPTMQQGTVWGGKYLYPKTKNWVPIFPHRAPQVGTQGPPRAPLGRGCHSPLLLQSAAGLWCAVWPYLPGQINRREFGPFLPLNHPEITHKSYSIHASLDAPWLIYGYLDGVLGTNSPCSGRYSNSKLQKSSMFLTTSQCATHAFQAPWVTCIITKLLENNSSF